jgi:hypothetical protein
MRCVHAPTFLCENDVKYLQDVSVRPHSAPIDGGYKGNGSEGKTAQRMSEAISSLPRLHIQQLHTRLPVFREISLSPDASYDATDVSSQVSSMRSFPYPCC